MKKPAEKSKEYREFVSSETGIICVNDGSCCRMFGERGPAVSEEEKPALIEVLNKKGLHDLADKLKQKSDLPTIGDKALAMKCIFQEGNICSVHEIKPGVCQEYPLFFSTKEDKIRLDVDTACGQVDEKRFNGVLKRKFKERFNKDLDINLYHSIEQRARRYLND